MPWFTAECLYRSEIDRADESEQLCELRYFLLKADDDDSAKQKSLELAKKKQHAYKNENGATVNWVLEGVTDVKEVLAKNLVEETEIYHKYFSRTG